MRECKSREKVFYVSRGATALVILALLAATTASRTVMAAFPWVGRKHCHTQECCAPAYGQFRDAGAGEWFWMRSPEQEQRVVISLYNRYCIRCHGVDGRGVWDIPDVPDFTNALWQASRPDPYVVRVIVEGRGAVMPPFRGTLTLEEAWAMARYLRTFVPGTEVSRPDLGGANTPPAQPTAPAPAVNPAPPDPTPGRDAQGPFSR